MALYLVTGGAGFIGSKVILELLNTGNSVVTIDNLSTGDIENIPAGANFIQGDCQDLSIISNLSGFKFDAILHIAGQSSGEISFEDPVYDLQTNTQSTLLLLDYAVKSGCKKFIYASTMSIYGNQRDVLSCDEDSSLNPISFYGVGKLASEHYMRIYQSYGISCISLRLFNVYGPGQNLKNLKQGMISIYLEMALALNRIEVKGSGDRLRDFVYIDDVVRAFSLCLAYKHNMFQVFNISTGIGTKVKRVLEIIKECLRQGIEIEYLSSTPGDQFGIVGNNEKSKIELGWEPKVGVEIGISKMVSWALEEFRVSSQR